MTRGAITMTDTLARPVDGQLSLREQLFVNAYLGEAKGNGAEAARIAGYKHKNPSAYAKRLLDKDIIRARVENVIQQADVSTERILQELADVAFADWKHFLIIKRNKDGDEVEVKMDLSSKVKSLELLGKHKQMFKDQLDINVKSVHIELNGVDMDRIGNVIDAESTTQGDEG